MNQLKETAVERYIPPVDIAVGYAGLGQKEEALDWLEKAYLDRTPRLTSVRLDPRFDELRAEARFGALMNKMGLTV